MQIPESQLKDKNRDSGYMSNFTFDKFDGLKGDHSDSGSNLAPSPRFAQG